MPERDRSDSNVSHRNRVRSPSQQLKYDQTPERRDLYKQRDKSPHHSKKRGSDSQQKSPHSRDKRLLLQSGEDSGNKRNRSKRKRSKSPPQHIYPRARTRSRSPMDSLRRDTYADYRPRRSRSKSPNVTAHHRKRSISPQQRSWTPLQRRRSRSRSPQQSAHYAMTSKSPKQRRHRRSRERSPHRARSREKLSPIGSRSKYLSRERSRSRSPAQRSRFSRSPRSPIRGRSRERDRTPPQRHFRSRTRSPAPKRGRSPRSRSPREDSRNRSSTVLLDNNKYSSTSFAAELMKQHKFKKKTPQNASQLMDGPTSSTSTPTSLSSLPTKTFLPTPNQNVEFEGQMHPQHNGFVAMKSTTLPQLPLPVIPSPHNKSLRVTPTPVTRLSSLPLPSTSPVEMEEDDESHPRIQNPTQTASKRPKILSKNLLPQQHQQQEPRCVDVFDIICQIGEGTYGQVYKARDAENWLEFEISISFMII